MLLPHVREFFLFSIAHIPTVVSEPGLRSSFVRIEHNELWAFDLLVATLLRTFGFAVWFDAAARTNFTVFGLRPVLHLTCNLYCICSLRVSVALTIVLTTFTKEGSYEIKKQLVISALWFLRR